MRHLKECLYWKKIFKTMSRITYSRVQQLEGNNDFRRA
uniref:Uncharacterized protein n=1 Tax=Klebsiella pneumoniae TaxID=573 RepID=A0A8B0SZP1_KLEPN|nr:hypothetical protein [Klebsiella pneumoniae]